jgi:phosphoglycerate dehydrogenase-like enzyme
LGTGLHNRRYGGQVLKKALFILQKEKMDKIYGPEEIARVNEVADVYMPVMSPGVVRKNPGVLRECNIILSGWGGPLIDGWFLEKAPELEAVFYGAGSIRGIVTPEFWEKDIPITSSWAANAIPVAEYTFAQIILCLKNAYRMNKMYTIDYPRIAAGGDRSGKLYDEFRRKMICDGAYRTKVGIISLGMIGRAVCKLLRNLDVDVMAFDPYISTDEADELGVKMVSLDVLFKQCNVVSLHAPWLPQTESMIKREHFEMMKPGAAFINTARGAIVEEAEMIDVLARRNDITAVIDVTHPEPPKSDSLLYTLDNVFLTPHIAGSLNDECKRMGKYAVDELIRYLNNEPLKYRITEEQFSTMA